MKFNNGMPMTAADVVFTYNFIKKFPAMNLAGLPINSASDLYAGDILTGTATLSDKQYRRKNAWTLWGRRGTPDVLICSDTQLDIDGDGTAGDCSSPSGMTTYLNNLNNMLAISSTLRNDGHNSTGYGDLSIEQIQVYRPPVDYDLKVRYGIATIECTAVKRGPGGKILARRTVRDVVQEIPFPGPDGAIESQGTIQFGGSTGVHWGMVQSSGTNNIIQLPDRNNNFPDAAFPRSTSTRWGFHYSFNPAYFQDLSQANGAANVETALTEMLDISVNGGDKNSNWSPEKVQDPWLLFRARDYVAYGNNSPQAVCGNQSFIQPCPYAQSSAITGNLGGGAQLDHLEYRSNWSHMFNKQIVAFPDMDYQTWKDISRSNGKGLHYLKYISAPSNYQEPANNTGTHDWLYYIDLNSTGSNGLFFFDTTDSNAPNANNTNLTPNHGWASNTYAEGFFYVNSQAFDSSGAGQGTDKECNYPGEPFLDDGLDLKNPNSSVGDDCICLRYDEDSAKCLLGARPVGWQPSSGTGGCQSSDLAGDACKCDQNTLNTMNSDGPHRAVAQLEAGTFRNGVWDRDLDNDGVPDTDAITYGRTDTPWTRFTANNTGSSDSPGGGHCYAAGVLPGYGSANNHGQGQTLGVHPAWKRDPRFLNHLDDWGATASDRQPHEPFLNLDYYLTNSSSVGSWPNSQGQDHGVKLNYQSDHAITHKTNGAADAYTTRARDATGALLTLSLHINGVMYFQGQFTGSGNVKVYGSMLMKQGYSSTGSLDIWFNEGLLNGTWPPSSWKLPRIYPSSVETN